MSNESSGKPSQPLEGEGNYSATRKYNDDLAAAIESGNLPAGAEEARRAMDGPEREALERAAQEAKRGPRQSPAVAVPASPAKPSKSKG